CRGARERLGMEEKKCRASQRLEKHSPLLLLEGLRKYKALITHGTLASNRWVPPYVLWYCLRFFPDEQGVFPYPCCHCACSKGVQALGSVKRLETILLFWRYINNIELN